MYYIRNKSLLTNFHKIFSSWLKTCDKIRGLANKFHVSLKNVDAALREAVANGVTKVQDLYNAAVKYIIDKWTGIFGDEPISKRSITDGNFSFPCISLKNDNRLQDVIWSKKRNGRLNYFSCTVSKFSTRLSIAGKKMAEGSRMIFVLDHNNFLSK